ncbi:MAG: agmatinase, partial [Cyanobacteria bacterium P01_E01_bin.34]
GSDCWPQRAARCGRSLPLWRTPNSQTLADDKNAKNNIPRAIAWGILFCGTDVSVLLAIAIAIRCKVWSARTAHTLDLQEKRLQDYPWLTAESYIRQVELRIEILDEFHQWAAPGYPVFLGSELIHPQPQDAFFHVLPVPMEASVSYGAGTRFGPKAILEASWQLEAWDGQGIPLEKGIYTHAPVNVAGDAADVVDRIAVATLAIVEMGRFPVVLGGEHTVTYGVIKGLLAAGVTDLGVVQVDAHGDLREAYEGNPYSHASVMKRIADLRVPLFQLGVRAISKEEIEYRKQFDVGYLDADVLVPQNISAFDLPEDFPTNVFFTLDTDGMDPSIFPSTGTPVPGGLGWYQTLALFDSVVSQRRVIGFDVMEFAPIAGFHAYEFAMAQLIYKFMGAISL